MVKAKKKNKKTKKKTKKRGRIVNTPPPRKANGQLISGWGRGSKQIKKKKPKIKVKRNALGHILPGERLNPVGGPKSTSRIDALNAAITRVEKEKNQSFLDMCVKKAWDDTAMATAILKKLHPDLRAIEQLNIPCDSMADKEAAEIRERMKKRFGG